MIKLKPAWTVIITGAVFGIIFSLLVRFGNPANMGACLLCFYRDIAGALGLHKIESLAYLRPEIIGFILGALVAGIIWKELRSVGGSSPLLRFVISMFVAFGGLVFLGCPTRMMGRIAGGDPTALVGLVGLMIGVLIGIWFLKSGFNLGEAKESGGAGKWIIPVIVMVLLLFVIIKPAFIITNPKGHAPLIISLLAGLIVGVLAQRSRFCFVGGFKNALMMGDFRLLQGLVSFLLFCFLANLSLGQFHAGAHPVAHTYHFANFLGMTVVGWGSTLIGGCPFRQTIMAGQGNTDSGMSVLGMVAGGALAHNFLVAAKPSGIAVNSMPVLVIGLLFFAFISLINRRK